MVCSVGKHHLVGKKKKKKKKTVAWETAIPAPHLFVQTPFARVLTQTSDYLTKTCDKPRAEDRRPEHVLPFGPSQKRNKNNSQGCKRTRKKRVQPVAIITQIVCLTLFVYQFSKKLISHS